MVYIEAARKTCVYLLVSAVLGLGVLTFLTEDLETPTGNAIAPAAQVAGGDWLVFALGLFIGGLMLGTYIFIAHLDGKRHA